MTDPTPATVQMRATNWLLGTDTGASSKALCAYMLNASKPPRHVYPSDGGDLGRCLRLLELIPEWKPRISEMAAHGPYWAALVARWSDLAASLAEETGSEFDNARKPSPKTYKLMRKILDPIVDRDPAVIRLGPGVTMRFGD